MSLYRKGRFLELHILKISHILANGHFFLIYTQILKKLLETCYLDNDEM